MNSEDEDDQHVRPRQAEVHFRAARAWLGLAAMTGNRSAAGDALSKASTAAHRATTLDPSRAEYRSLAEEIERAKRR